MKFTIPGVAPAQKSLMRPNGSWYANPALEEWDEAVKTATKDIKAPAFPFYAVTIQISPPSTHSKLSSRVKQTLDALTRAGFWKDDQQVATLAIKYGNGKKKQTTISIKEAKEKWR